MKTLLRTLFLAGTVIFYVSCSKNDDGSPMAYFPTTITMENTNGESAHYEIEYNTSNAIDNIAFQRAISGIPTSFLSQFNYDSQQRLMSVETKDISNGVTSDIAFKYDENGNLVDMRYVTNLSEREVNLGHDKEVNTYSVSFEDYSNFTLILNTDNALSRIQFPSSELTITPSDSGQGVFQQLPDRVPLQIWLITTFGPNLDLFFFQNKDISNVLIDDHHFNYGNKSWDMSGNLLTYQVTNTNDPLTTTYLIQYEIRGL